MADTKPQPPPAREEAGTEEGGESRAVGDGQALPPPHHRASAAERIEQLRALKQRARAGGGVQAIERQHARGKLTARERLELLLDVGSFVEMDPLARDRMGAF